MDKEQLIEQYLKEIRKQTANMTEQEIQERISGIQREENKSELGREELNRILTAKPIIDRAILGTYLDITDSKTFTERFGMPHDYLDRDSYSQERTLDEKDLKDYYIGMICKAMLYDFIDPFITRVYRPGESRWEPEPEDLILDKSNKYSIPIKEELVKLYEGQFNRATSLYLHDLYKIVCSTIPGVDKEKVLSFTNDRELNNYLFEIYGKNYVKDDFYVPRLIFENLPELLKAYIESLNPQMVFNDEHELEQQEETRRGKHFR